MPATRPAAAPSADAVLAELRALGRDQTRATYLRHGASPTTLGVSYADLGKLKKRIRTDHDLALALWESGVHEARVLATMVADPARADDAMLDRWAAALDSYPLADAFAAFALATPRAGEGARRWRDADHEWLEQAGWQVTSGIAQGRAAHATLGDDECAALLARIEREIGGAKNRVRHAMNGAVIGIGARGGAMERAAVAAAKRIGKVEVDHGATACVTPDAVAYIAKVRAHAARKSR
jgi:3-methyladenine DNA glycosylase AlkD